ncbi:hypothetical protein PIB30_061629 [Stylosanthes scabra]|uniref:Aminotransferase-like plant mobile domain-containing protein n=1 Tax=Stylosanthes scabra TaxID=79078 RepID=A0ABU6SLE9_9FABA|nr:hypothetical protein [Stylosanthes scabra]
MPKKAIVASSRDKGIRLALPGPIKQSQSGYESGSSTQQPAQKSTKQSTQSPQSKNEVGPFTQQPKQTKVDYAFPIQTLMALQDQGVTKLNKQSWAEICKFWDEFPHKVIPKIFPTGFHFKPTSPIKTRQFYEFILVDTDSDFFGPIPEILPSPTDEGYKLFQSKFDIQETCVPAMLKFFSIFSLSWVFLWQYQYGKSELDYPKALPTLQRHAYVKWWSQFDSSMAYPEKVREWFKSNPRSLKTSDPETASFLNQKAQIQAALAGSQSKKSIKGKLKQILHLLQEDEELSPNEESDQDDNQNEEDCFEINLDDD